MTVGEMKAIIMDLADDTEIEINSVLNEKTNELEPRSCDGFYHKGNNKIYLTPEVIAL